MPITTALATSPVPVALFPSIAARSVAQALWFVCDDLMMRFRHCHLHVYILRVARLHLNNPFKVENNKIIMQLTDALPYQEDAELVTELGNIYICCCKCIYSKYFQYFFIYAESFRIINFETKYMTCALWAMLVIRELAGDQQHILNLSINTVFTNIQSKRMRCVQSLKILKHKNKFILQIVWNLRNQEYHCDEIKTDIYTNSEDIYKMQLIKCILNLLRKQINQFIVQVVDIHDMSR